MKVYSYSQARQHFAEVLDTAKKEEVLIRRKGGDMFAVVLQKPTKSPFDVPSVKTQATTADILAAIRQVRSR
jgi:GGDEF domain-containing protein